MMSSVRGTALVRYGVPGLLAGLVLAWGMGGTRAPQAQAQSATPSDTSGTIAFTAAGPGSTQLLYIIDSRSQAFAVYQIDLQDIKGALKLEAARQYRWDLKLAQFNNQAPDVSSVEAMVGGLKR